MKRQRIFNAIILLVWIPTVVAWVPFAALFRLQMKVATALNGRHRNWYLFGVFAIPKEMVDAWKDEELSS